MDLRQLAAAFRAHRVATAIGVCAAIFFAFLAHVRVDPGGSPMFQYRKSIVWGSKITMQLTQEGFPEGRVEDLGSRRQALIDLTPLYARLATTDPVRRRMRRAGPILGGVRVDPVVDENSSSLPVIKIASFALSKDAAVTRVERQARAFIGYIANEQRVNGVTPRNRVILKVLSGPTTPAVVIPRKKTLPVVVFLAMLVITAGVVLVLENLRKVSRQGSETRELRKTPDGHGEAPRRVPVTPAPVDAKPSARPAPVAAPQPATARTVALPPARRTLGAERPTELRSAAPPDGDRADDMSQPARKSRASRGRSH